MSSIVLSSVAVLRQALLVVLLVAGAALPTVAADPVASNATMTVRNGAATSINLSARSDPRTTLTYVIVTQGTKGTVTLNGRRATYTVTSGINPVGSDQFTFRVTDNNGRTSNTATVAITFTNTTTVTWSQPTPIVYGTAIDTPATATAGGVPVAGTFVYTPPLGTVLPVGNRRITAVFTPAGGGASVTRAMNVRVNAMPLTVTSTASKVYGASLPAFTPTYSGFVNGDSAASVLTGAPRFTTTASATSPVGSYPITASRGNLRANSNYRLTYVTGSLAVTPAAATVAISGLDHTYDGDGHAATVTTTPAGLATAVTYDGSTLLPVDAGSYAVSASITDPNYTGSSSATLVIGKATAQVLLSATEHTYDGNGHAATVTTVPAGLTTSVTYAGGNAAPVNAGAYAIDAQVDDGNYIGSATGVLTIAKAEAQVLLGDLAQSYTGAARPVSVTTIPADLPVSVTYDEGAVAPIAAGSYAVTATVNDPNHTGSATGTLVVGQGAAVITLGDLVHTYDGNPHAASVTTDPADLAVTVTYDGGASIPTTAGTYAVEATIVDANLSGSASGSLTIAKAAQHITLGTLADVTVGDADQPVTASATSGLPVTLSVSGPAEIIDGVLHVTGAGAITVTAAQAGDSNWLAAADVSQTITAAPAVGTGLLGSYYANRNLSGAPVLTRVDSQVNFDWGNGSPHSSVPADQFSIRWDGEIVPRFNETYTLTFRTDDGVRVWFDGQLVVNYWSDRSAGNSTYTFAAQAGRHYRVRMEFYENGGLAVAKVLWQSPSEPSAPIPASQLYPVPPDNSGPIGTGTGLTASYFANETFAGVPAVTRLDAVVDFDWAGGSPASGIPADSFSARWSGEIQPRYSEPYTLTLRTDDGVRMWLDGQLVIDAWVLRSAADSNYTFTAEAGRRYAVRIEFYEHTGSAVAQLRWYSAREAAGAVPTSQLYPLLPPTVTVAEVDHPLAEREPVVLVGTVENPGSVPLTYGWTTVSGPAVATFQPADQTTTTARFPQAGTYQVALAASNGHAPVADVISVTVEVSDITSNLVAHYTFDEGAGSLALDSSGFHHTGTLVGGVWESAGKSGGALRFDGFSQVNVNPASTLDVVGDQALTLSVWLKADRSFVDMTAPWAMPIYKASHETSQGYGLMVTYTDTNLFGMRVLTGTGLGNRREAAIEDPAFGEWVHYTGVYDGSSVSLYRNGLLVNSLHTGPMVVNPATLTPLILGRSFEGLMDEVRIYRRALSRVDVFGLVQEDLQRALPRVHAGGDQIASLLAPAITLVGTVSGDSTLQTVWRQVSGPAAVTIANATTLTPTMTFTTAGDYRFELQASDGVLVGRDAVDVAVLAGAADLSTGLVLHYRLDETSGTVAEDSSVNALVGTLSGNATFTTEGQVAGGLNLGGTGKVTTPGAAPINSLSQMSLSLWMKPERTLAAMATSAALGIYHADFATHRGYGLMAVAVDSNLFGLRLHTGTGRKEVTVMESTAGQWLHYVGTFNGSEMRLYRNGEQVNINRTGAFTVPAVNVPLRVGEGFEGIFDDVRIYDRPLTPTEVRALHLAPPITSNG